MSAVKSPKMKKELSLKRDRRNTYGENNKSSRKNIRRSKQLAHMRDRRVAGEVLGKLKGSFEEGAADEVESTSKARSLKNYRRSFKKTPDTALGIVLERKGLRKGKT